MKNPHTSWRYFVLKHEFVSFYSCIFLFLSFLSIRFIFIHSLILFGVSSVLPPEQRERSTKDALRKCVKSNRCVSDGFRRGASVPWQPPKCLVFSRRLFINSTIYIFHIYAKNSTYAMNRHSRNFSLDPPLGCVICLLHCVAVTSTALPVCFNFTWWTTLL
jgi:hypothetical protein